MYLPRGDGPMEVVTMSEQSGRKNIVIFVCIILIIAVVVVLRVGKSAKSTPSAPEVKPASTPAAVRQETEAHSFRFDGSVPGTFHEAPELSKQVEDGKLPPVETRLPDELLIIPPVERIGKYGGTWHRAFTGPADGQNMDRLLHDHLIYYDLDGVTLVPHIAKSWELSEGARVVTFKLRKGMKWSDGTPFTADAFVFAYEDLLLNDELNPVKPAYMRHGGELGRVEKVDDYTVRYVFAKPYRTFPAACASLLVGGQSARGRRAVGLYAPGHYLKQFHQKYVPEQELNAKVAESGLGDWVQLFKQRAAADKNRELPVVGPWKVVSPITSQMLVLERNPYYWAVDPEGNQLPYIDRIEMAVAENLEVLNLRAIAGEIDMQHRHIQLAKVPVLKANAAKGGYRVLFWPGKSGTEAALFINQTWRGDPEIGRWLRDRDFRIALSLAIDRDEINETIFLGTGKAKAFVPSADTPFYLGPEYETKYAVRDLGKASDILDPSGAAGKGRWWLPAAR